MIGRRGITLVELLVTLAIMGVIASVAGLALHLPPAPPSTDTFAAQIASLRDSALASGRPVTVIFVLDGRAGAATAYPDGRVLSELGTVDPATGRPRATD